MRPHPKIRKTIKWGGAAVTVLLVVVWIGSGWWQVSWMSRHGRSIGVGSGGAYCVLSLIDVTMSDTQRGFRLRTLPRYLQTWNFNYRKTTDVVVASVPIWFPCSILIVATVIAWRIDTLARRRARMNLCPKCNYDRAGIGAGAVCPECGERPTVA